ncbi:MAG TPA: Asd/ArgC dimerization domain-containing protein [Terriglobales bacterium]|nr:Asd/ArgC dimerization domain-containing protein [Terriglobales bacterium]
MSSNLKSAVLLHNDATRTSNLYRIAIVGASTLKGKEVAEVLNDRNFPSIDIKLLDDDDTLGQLEAMKDEVTFIQSVRPEQFDNLDFAFFACDQECTRKNWKIASKAGSAVIDLSYALEGEPDASIRSPWVERQLGQALAIELQPRPAVIAHPAAIALALILLRTQKFADVKKAVATVFEPASEHGQKGMDELHEQTVNLLSFQQLPKNVFDTQVAFNMVSRYGEKSATALTAVQDRVLKHYSRIVADNAPAPSVLVVQAPTFHGHTFALHVELTKAADIAEIAQALAGDHIKMTHLAEEAPSNVNAAGQSDIQVSLVPDVRDGNSFWVWAASDNLRVAATTAVECAETMAATRPRGKIQ